MNGLLVFLALAFAYFLSYAFRAVNAVIAPDLLSDLGLGAGALGLLASAYFLSFAAMQLPLGLLLDRLGPRRVESMLLMVAALGAALFAMAESFAALWVARALIGVGVSACLMAAYKAHALWYPARQQASLSSWTLMAGSLGAVSVTTPVAWLLPQIGWRGVFWGLAGATLLAAWLIHRQVPRFTPPPQPEGGPSPAAAALDGLREVLRSRALWIVAPLGIFQQGGFMAVQSLWAGPWFRTVEGLEPVAVGHALFATNLAILAAYALLGGVVLWLGRHRIGLDRIMVVGLVIHQLLMAWVIVWPGQWPVTVWCLAYAFASVATLGYTLLSQSFPVALTGRASTAINFLIFAGAFAIQWGIGLAVDGFRAVGLSPVDALRAALAVLLGLQVLSLLRFGFGWRHHRQQAALGR